jgi:integrase
LEDVGEAIIDYLRYGRPKSKYREVFLRINAPFKPFVSSSALYTIFDFYRRRAKVTTPLGRGGIHSLRHTAATRMLEKNIPVEIISEVLGHVSVESTHIYTKVDIKALRSAALNPDNLQEKGA